MDRKFEMDRPKWNQTVLGHDLDDVTEQQIAEEIRRYSSIILSRERRSVEMRNRIRRLQWMLYEKEGASPLPSELLPLR